MSFGEVTPEAFLPSEGPDIEGFPGAVDPQVIGCLPPLIEPPVAFPPLPEEWCWMLDPEPPADPDDGASEAPPEDPLTGEQWDGGSEDPYGVGEEPWVTSVDPLPCDGELVDGGSSEEEPWTPDDSGSDPEVWILPWPLPEYVGDAWSIKDPWADSDGGEQDSYPGSWYDGPLDAPGRPSDGELDWVPLPWWRGSVAPGDETDPELQICYFAMAGGPLSGELSDQGAGDAPAASALIRNPASAGPEESLPDQPEIVPAAVLTEAAETVPEASGQGAEPHLLALSQSGSTGVDAPQDWHDLLTGARG